MSEQYGEGVLVGDSITSLLDTVGLVSICKKPLAVDEHFN
jgi:hypothetical protein